MSTLPSRPLRRPRPLHLDLPSPVDDSHPEDCEEDGESNNRRKRDRPCPTPGTMSVFVHDQEVVLHCAFHFSEGSATLSERRSFGDDSPSEYSNDSCPDDDETIFLSAPSEHGTCDSIGSSDTSVAVVREKKSDHESAARPGVYAAPFSEPRCGNSSLSALEATIRKLEDMIAQSPPSPPPLPTTAALATFPRSVHAPSAPPSPSPMRPLGPKRSFQHPSPRTYNIYELRQRALSASTTRLNRISEVPTIPLSPNVGLNMHDERRRSVSLMTHPIGVHRHAFLNTEKPLPPLPLNLPIPPIPTETPKRTQSLVKKTSQRALKLVRKMSEACLDSFCTAAPEGVMVPI